MYVAIRPDSAIEFKFSPDGTSTSSLLIQNIVSMNIAFKIKTSVPKFYIAKPSQGILSPNESKEIIITLQPLHDFPYESKHKFLVQTAPTSLNPSQNKDLANFWSSSPDQCQNTKLRVVISDVDKFQISNTFHSVLAESRLEKSENLKNEIKNLKDFQDKQEISIKRMEEKVCKILEQQSDETISKVEIEGQEGYGGLHLGITMKCYICSDYADYICQCEMPSKLICESHLNLHKQEPSDHVITRLSLTESASKFMSAKSCLSDFKSQILESSAKEISDIKRRVENTLTGVTHIIHWLEEQYSKRVVDENAIIEAAHQLELVPGVTSSIVSSFCPNYKSQVSSLTLDQTWKFGKLPQYKTYKEFVKTIMFKGESINNELDGQGMAKYSDGSIYEGAWKAGDRHGFGTFSTSDKSVYIGEWKFDRKHGLGKFTQENGEIYEGDWENNMKTGTGKIMYPNGDSYTGGFLENIKNGKGVFKWVNGSYDGYWKNNLFDGEGTLDDEMIGKYSGQFVAGKKEGKGKLVDIEERVYEGNWKADICDGNGKLYYIDKNQNYHIIYEGDWKNGLKHGNGIYKFSNGDVYQGEWEKDKMHGNGSYVSFFSRYEGEWKNGERDGKGVEKFTNGETYKGDWKNSKRNGFGQAVYPNDSTYDGEWLNGVKEGKGLIKSKNGDLFDGFFKNDLKYGKGKYTYSNGESYDGNWNQDIKEGEGIFNYLNGDVYVGTFQNDLKDGLGIMTYSNGESYDGSWHKGMREGNGIFNYLNGDIYEGVWKENECNGEGTLNCQNNIRFSGVWTNGKRNGEFMKIQSNGAVKKLKFKEDVEECIIF